MAAEALKVFSLNSYTISLGGIILSGYAEDGACDIEANGDHFTTTEGVDGSVARGATGSRLYKVTFKLLKTSKSNALMTALWQSDINTDGGAGVVPCLIKDGLGLDFFFSPNAYIVRPPAMKIHNKVWSHEWECMAANGKLFAGGN